MNLLDAFHATVHDYPGGCESLAPRMAMSSAVLRNKANPRVTTNHPLLIDADRAMALTGDFRILHTLAANHAHVCYRIDSDVPASDLAVLELVTHVWSANGNVGAAVEATLADGRVERHELSRVRDAIYRQQQTLLSLLARLEDMAEPDPSPRKEA